METAGLLKRRMVERNGDEFLEYFYGESMPPVCIGVVSLEPTSEPERLETATVVGSFTPTN